MKTTTKAFFLSSVLLSSASIWAAPVTFSYVDTSATGGYSVSNGGSHDCSSLNTTDVVKVALSANVAGAYDCNGVNVGIATANQKGRGKAYRVHTAGGAAPVEVANTVRYTDIAAAKTKAGTEATNALNDAGT